jgi:hypothetical protein
MPPSVSKKFPSLLWHYTTFNGLNGIVAGGQLIASSLAYLNDTAEFLYTIQPLLAHLETAGVSLNDLARGLFPSNVESMVKIMFEKHVRGDSFYVTCFSKEPDDLSQWRSYTPHPPGFAIGFEPDELIPLANSHHFAAAECKYPKEDELRAEVLAAYENAIKGMDEDKSKLPIPVTDELRESFIEKWAIKVVTAVMHLAPQRKHPKFAAEKEVRLLAMAPLGEIEYRQSGSLLVPYIRFPARPKKGPSTIKAVIVSPCPHQDAVIAVTRQMCLQHHVHAEVLASEVPYRNW